MAKRPPVPDDVFKDICKGMLDAEQSGELSGLFKGECRESRDQFNKEQFFSSLIPGMKLYRSTFLKMFGYDISTPGFAGKALVRLKILGCSRAEEYYNIFIGEWKKNHEKMLQEVAAWYRKQSFNKEGVRMSRRQLEVEQTRWSSGKWMENLY